MSLVEVALISIGLAMDAFAVSVCKGLSMKKIEWKKVLTIALYFGSFQALMPIIGFLLGNSFRNFIEDVDHWVAFVLLSFIGFNMIKEAFDKEDEKRNDKIDFKTMFILSLATSVDALAIGITFAFLNVNIVNAILIIGITTFLLSILGVKIGNKFGDKLQNKAELCGGIILIIIGLKILLEHLEII